MHLHELCVSYRSPGVHILQGDESNYEGDKDDGLHTFEIRQGPVVGGTDSDCCSWPLCDADSTRGRPSPCSKCQMLTVHKQCSRKQLKVVDRRTEDTRFDKCFMCAASCTPRWAATPVKKMLDHKQACRFGLGFMDEDGKFSAHSTSDDWVKLYVKGLRRVGEKATDFHLGEPTGAGLRDLIDAIVGVHRFQVRDEPQPFYSGVWFRGSLQMCRSLAAIAVGHGFTLYGGACSNKTMYFVHRDNDIVNLEFTVPHDLLMAEVAADS